MVIIVRQPRRAFSLSLSFSPIAVVVGTPKLLTWSAFLFPIQSTIFQNNIMNVQLKTFGAKLLPWPKMIENLIKTFTECKFVQRALCPFLKAFKIDYTLQFVVGNFLKVGFYIITYVWRRLRRRRKIIKVTVGRCKGKG